MAYLKLLLSSGLLITVAMAFSTNNDSKNNSCTAINIDLPKSVEPLIYKIEFLDIIPQIKIKEKNYTNGDTHSITQYNEEQQAKYGFIYHGISTIDVPIDRKMKTICLHILNLQIHERQTVLVFTHKINNTERNLKPIKHLYNDEEQTVVFDFGDYILTLLGIQLDFVICKLRVEFSGNITDNQESDFFITSYIDGIEKERHWLIAVGNFQAIGARQVFPCWDGTTIKTKFQISINHGKKYTTLSNVQIKHFIYEDSRNDMSRTEFHLTDEIPPYLLTFVVFDLPLFSYVIGTYEMDMWSRRFASLELEFAWVTIRKVTHSSKKICYKKCNKTDVPSILEEWYKKSDEANKTRISKMKLHHVVIPGFRDEGIGSFGLVYYSEAAIIYNEALDTIACKIKIAQIVARKTILSLFGNMIPLSSWSHLWLNEGIATFMGMYITDQTFPDFRMMDLFVVQIQHDSLRLNFYYDARLIVETNTISDIKSLFSLTRYLKAPVFMRMLQHVMTNERFLLGLNLYLERQFITVKNRSADTSNLTFDNFWIAMTTSLETTFENKSNLQEKFNNWMVHGHYPVLNVTRDYKEEDTNVIIKLSQRESYSNYWRIPVTYTTKTKSNFTKTSPDYWLEPQTSFLIVPLVYKDDWIIVNIQQAGYYRVNYDWKNWKLIADYLRFEDHTRIHVLNRAQIIDDSFHFLLTREIRYSIFLNLTAYLSKETDYIAWYPMFKVFEQMSVLWPYQASASDKRHMLHILNGLLDKIGYEEIPFENPLTVSLRQEAAKWACTFGSTICKETANKILTKHLLENKIQNFLPGWQHWTYCKGLMIAKKSIWDKMLHLHTNFGSNNLEFLTCSEDSNIITDYLTFLSTIMSYNNDKISKNAYINSFFSLIAKHAKNDVVLDYLLENFYTIISNSKINEITALTSIINHVYSREQIHKIESFLMDNYSKLNSYNSITRKLEIRISEIYKQFRYFLTVFL